MTYKINGGFVVRSPENDCYGSVGQSALLLLPSEYERIIFMLYTLAVFLVILWLFGLITSYTIGGFIHVLLVIAIIVVLVRIIQGRKVL
jgi:hypothetical protein